MTERYHTISLVAVFLALTAGMVIGVFFLQTPTLAKVSKQINDLRARADQIQTEYRAARVSLDDTKARLHGAMSAVAPQLQKQLDGKLRNRGVAIIQLGANAEALAGAAQSIQLAGGEVATTITVDSNSISDDSEAELGRLLGHLSAGLNTASIHDLAGVTIEPATGKVRPIRLVVVIGGFDKPPTNGTVEGSLLDELARHLDLRVVGVEGIDAEISSVPSFIGKGIPSIDCVDTALGQLALPYVLLGSNGAFGVKRNADSALPPAVFGEP